MLRSIESPRPLARKLIPRVGLAFVAAIAIGPLFPSAQSERKPRDVEAATLQRDVRQGRPVPYEANLGVESTERTPGGKLVVETTVMALEYDPDSNPDNGNEDYFRLTGSSLETLRALRITDPNLVPQDWDPQHPGVTVTSHEGVINTDNVAHMPATTIHLSSGEDRYVAVGQTSANP